MQWIEDSRGLERVCATFDDEIGLDTEFIRTDTFYPVPGLYQIATAETFFLLDPLTIDNWQPFIEYLADPKHTLVMHACQEDLELLFHHLGTRPANVFDTQVAQAFVSVDYSLSYANLVAQRLGVVLEKQATRSNWLQRPLTERQLAYAVDDVRYLLALARQLNDDLRDTQRLAWFRQEMRERGHYVEGDPALYYKSVKKAWSLMPGELAVLQHLCAWREAVARSEDVPRGRVIKDAHLFEFAKQPDLTAATLQTMLPPSATRRYGDALLTHHREGLLRPQMSRLDPPLSAVENARVKALRSVASSLADDLGLAPELLARKRDVEACVRHYAKTAELTPLYDGWRGQLLGDQFKEQFTQNGAA